MKRIVVVVLFVASVKLLTAQIVGINTDNPDKSSALDINTPNKGFLPPRVNLTSITDVTTIEDPATGLMIYEPDGFTETVNGQSVVRPQGVYTYDGTQWIHLVASNDQTSSFGSSTISGVKVAVNQSGYITLQGRQSYGLLMQNAGVTINPTYVTGVWTPPSDEPSDLITDGSGGDNGARLLNNQVIGGASIFRLDFNYMLGNNPPADTRYFTVDVVSVTTGATVYSERVVVPGGLNTGHVAPFEVSFLSLVSENSINTGYKVIFGVDTAGSNGLPGNVSVMFLSVVRVN